MGRTIGGFFVGLISMFIISAILLVILAFVMGPEGIIDLETKEPQQLWLIVGMIGGGAGAFFGGVIARAIGKSRGAPLSILGFMLLLVIYGLVSGPREMSAEQVKQLESVPMNAMVAMSYAQQNAPQTMSIIGSIVSLVALAVGGLKLSDFGSNKTSEEGQEQPLS